MPVYNANAKLNLYLHITGKRPDGYHELESIFIPIDLADQITIEPTDNEQHNLRITGSHAAGLSAEENLVLDALAILEPLLGKNKASKFDITLEKHIPHQAGLGGGSSDAACILKAANDLWNIGLGNDELVKLALNLGADVPFFIYNKPSFVSGIGEHVTPYEDFPDLMISLASPNISLSTARVFEHLQGKFSPAQGMPEPRNKEEWITFLANQRNDLEEVAIKLAPEVGTTLDSLRQQPGVRFARMSGSGSMCFLVRSE